MAAGDRLVTAPPTTRSLLLLQIHWLGLGYKPTKDRHKNMHQRSRMRVSAGVYWLGAGNVVRSHCRMTCRATYVPPAVSLCRIYILMPSIHLPCVHAIYKSSYRDDSRWFCEAAAAVGGDLRHPSSFFSDRHVDWMELKKKYMMKIKERRL